MARAELTVTYLGGTRDPDNPVLITWNAGDSVNNHYWDLQPGDRVIARNTGTAAVQVTLKGAADPQGRSDDVAQSIAAGAAYAWGPLQRSGWNQTGGEAYIDVDTDTDPEIAILRG